ncbi:hypothetical protein T4E_11082 [Trichinella pseudospiralis]|uniref:Uncharacterized protein n=1 Tax=Trichinella pseudospiralis TaxID=6337 RepID=A0A0V0YM38_TRIPS|nr:hypothetical protein T4E_11082 [Trichinella pseudospiralis]KRY92606.1 hypothetical protein T4D_3571 [Trichinella pseudospiralis]
MQVASRKRIKLRKAVTESGCRRPEIHRLAFGRGTHALLALCNLNLLACDQKDAAACRSTFIGRRSTLIGRPLTDGQQALPASASCAEQAEPVHRRVNCAAFTLTLMINAAGRFVALSPFDRLYSH